MIFIVCNKYIEAKAIIKYFNLKKKEDKYFQIFTNKELTLIISGIGKTKCTVAVSKILSSAKLKPEDCIVNIGLCETSKNIEDVFLINKIIDVDLNKCFYPDILIKNNFKESSITTIIQSNEKNQYHSKMHLYDREASSFFQSANCFLAPHQIHIIKIASFLDEEEKVSVLINKHINRINEYLLKLKNQFREDEFYDVIEKELIKRIETSLKLTSSQKKTLDKHCISYKMKESNLVNQLSNFINYNSNNKWERNYIFNEIISKLSK